VQNFLDPEVLEDKKKKIKEEFIRQACADTIFDA